MPWPAPTCPWPRTPLRPSSGPSVPAPVVLQRCQSPAPLQLYSGVPQSPCPHGGVWCPGLELPCCASLPCSLAGRPCPATPRAPAALGPQGAASSYGSLAPIPGQAAPQSWLFLPIPKYFFMKSTQKPPTNNHPLRQRAAPSALAAALSGPCLIDRRSAKQGWAPPDRQTPEAVFSTVPFGPSSSTPTSFCPFLTEETSSGSGERWQGPGACPESSCHTQEGQSQVSPQKPRKLFHRSSKSVINVNVELWTPQCPHPPKDDWLKPVPAGLTSSRVTAAEELPAWRQDTGPPAPLMVAFPSPPPSAARAPHEVLR